MTEQRSSHYSHILDEITAERGPQGPDPAESKAALPEFIDRDGSGVYTLLDLQETSQPKRLKPTYREQFLAPCKNEYDATVAAYEQIYPHFSDGPRYALENCRRHAYFARDKVTGDVKVMTDSCRIRWCPMCAAQKAKYAREATHYYIRSLRSPRFLTLTLRHCEDSLKSQIEFLQDAFRRLRYRAYWKKRVFGGIWFLQVHRSENDGCWHPHFHILLDGYYLEQQKISDLWDLVSFGSPVIDIRKLHNPEEAASYVARYSARPAKFEKMLLADRVEMIEALKGKRLSGTFGSAKSVTLTPPKVESDADWQHIGYYDTVVKDAFTDQNAHLVLMAYAHGLPLTDDEFFEYTGYYPTQTIITAVKHKEIQYTLDFYNST